LFITLHTLFVPITKLFGLVISDENILKVSGNNKEELPMATMFLQGQD
jgi:hypothetical protein